MMRTNGTMQIEVSKAGVGFDENGVPMNVAERWGHPIPCLIQLANSAEGWYEDGKFNQYSYKVLVEDFSFRAEPKRIRLHMGGKHVGDFSVKGMPFRTSLNRIEISV